MAKIWASSKPRSRMAPERQTPVGFLAYLFFAETELHFIEGVPPHFRSETRHPFTRNPVITFRSDIPDGFPLFLPSFTQIPEACLGAQIQIR